MSANMVVKFLGDYREIIELILILVFMASSSVRGVIATVAEMLQSANAASDEVAMNKAVALLKKKIPLPDFLLRAIIQYFFGSMKKVANKEIAEIKAWNPTSM